LLPDELNEARITWAILFTGSSINLNEILKQALGSESSEVMGL
jgi:hypothetical protein